MFFRFFRNLPRRQKAIVLTTSLVVILVGVALNAKSPAPSITTTTPAGGRQAYATAYDALWRADDKRGDVLTTATWFSPDLHTLLRQAEEKTNQETQILDQLDELSSQETAFVITLDSVSGSFSDAVIKKSVEVIVDTKTAWVVKSWTPLVSASRLVNVPDGSSSQVGVVVVSSPNEIDWSALSELKLTLRSIGAVPVRSFVWSGGVLQSAASQ